VCPPVDRFGGSAWEPKGGQTARVTAYLAARVSDCTVDGLDRDGDPMLEGTRLFLHATGEATMATSETARNKKAFRQDLNRVGCAFGTVLILESAQQRISGRASLMVLYWPRRA
jgi:hypothetical protein